jgi:hypothetical protein
LEKWHIETEIVDSKITEYAQFFNVGFPKRSVMFFENVIGKIDGINSKLCILIIDKAIAGALILYSVDGFTFEVWAPSYFYVTKDKRNLSIPFLLKAQRLSSESVLNVTPNAYMRKVLEALKYKKHSYGSNVLFSIFSFESSSISWAKMPQDHSCIGIDSRFTGRNDLLWIVNSASEIEQLLCFKSSRWMGFKVWILVYCKNVAQNDIGLIIQGVAVKFLMRALVVYPNFKKDIKWWDIAAKKFRVYGNFKPSCNLYSLLGSEVTEIL